MFSAAAGLSVEASGGYQGAAALLWSKSGRPRFALGRFVLALLPVDGFAHASGPHRRWARAYGAGVRVAR